jgi:hypothetical protein
MKPDISFVLKSGHFHLLSTLLSCPPSIRNRVDDCFELLSVDRRSKPAENEILHFMARSRSLLLQRQRIDVVASNIAKHQRRVRWIQTHREADKTGQVPISQVGDSLRFSARDGNS